MKKMVKKIETIRVNEELALLLEDVSKGTSYANWLLDKLHRLDAHEQNQVCWIESTTYIGSNSMSNGDENGKHPIFDEIIEIVFEIPRTNSSHEERSEGWLGSNNDYNSYAHGGFASVESAKSYIIEYMGGRLIDNMELLRNEYPHEDENMEIYTTAKFNDFYFVSDWFEANKPNVKNLTDEQIGELVGREEASANKEGIGLLGDIEEYLIELRDSN